MSLVSIGQYNDLAYRQIFDLAQKIKGVRHRSATPTPLLAKKQILIVVRAENEPVAAAISDKLKELGGTVNIRYAGAISHGDDLLGDTTLNTILTIGCSHPVTQDIAARSHAPVINVCCSKHRPVHVLADIFPVYEKRGFNFKDVSFCWNGNAENSANTWLEAAEVMGFKLSLVPTPPLHLDPALLDTCQRRNHANISLGKTLTEADVTIYDTPDPDKRRLALSRKVDGANAKHNKSHCTTDAGLDFWDNKLCILIALMAWAQE